MHIQFINWRMIAYQAHNCFLQSKLQQSTATSKPYAASMIESFNYAKVSGFKNGFEVLKLIQQLLILTTPSNILQQNRQQIKIYNSIISCLCFIINQLIMNNITIVLILLLAYAVNTQYNHQTSTYLNTSWMSLLDNGIPIRKLSIIGTHSSMGTGAWGDAFQTQSNSLLGQMRMGIRALDIRCRHYNSQFPIHDRLVYLNTDLGGVLSTVTSFLQSYPMEAILMHIVEEYNPSGNNRSFEQTFIAYKNQYSNFIWNPTTQNPVLGEVRGKIVIIQDFSGVSIHGLMYSTFTVLPHKWYNTNWDQYDKWTAVKSFLSASNAAGESRLSFWTGHGGSFPYFVASGKSSPGNSDPRLATGLTTPGFSKSYPDFPRVACFIGICTIAFEGINILGFNYINSNNLNYLGIIFTDFVGDALLQKVMSLNVGKFTPCPSSLLTQGCTFCTSTGQCLGCNSTLHYLFNSANSSCYADKGYYLNWSSPTANSPTACSIPMVGCLQCSSDSVCLACDSLANYQLVSAKCEAAPGYYLNSSSIPVKCNIVGCYICASATVCTNCSALTNYIMDNSTQTCLCDSSKFFIELASAQTCICSSGYFLNNNTCDLIPLCPANNSGCASCTLGSPNSCSACDASNNFQAASFNPSYCVCADGYFYNGLSCDLCNATLTNACLTCISSTLCLSCKSNFTLYQGTCSCLPQYYLFNSDTCLLCEVGCLRCTSGSSCLICDTTNNFTLVSSVCQCNSGLFLNGSSCVPCGAMAGCLTCTNTGCTSCSSVFGFTLNASTSLCQCNYGFYPNNMSICQPCTQLGCLNCQTSTQCIECNNTIFYLDLGVCKDICGDGLLFALQCDDGNTVDGDGCSSNCTVEKDYTCVGGSTTSQSQCSFSGVVNIQVKSFVKDPNKNTAYFTSTISPNLKQFSALDFNTVFVPQFPIETVQNVYNPTSGTISMVFTYNQSLNDEKLSVLFVPPAVPAYFYMPKVATALPYTTDNNLALKLYKQEQYQLSKTVDTLTTVLAYSSVSLFVICFFFVSKLIAVEMIFIFQVAYTSLMYLEKLQLYMSPLKNLWIVNGYNQLIQDESRTLPKRVSQVYYKGSFLSNFSIDIILVLIPIIIGLIYLLFAKIRNSKDNRITSYRILKEWLFSVLLFVQLHLDISIYLGLNYSTNKMLIVVGLLIQCLLISQIILLIKRPKNFGEYTQFFLQSDSNQRWYLIVLVYRLAMSFIIGFLGSLSLGVIISLALAFIFMIVQFAKRPYQKNIRPAINCIFVVLILSIYTISKINQDSENTSIYTSYSPLVLIGILYLALLFNLICMVIHFISNCKRKEESKVVKQALKEDEVEGKNIDKIYIKQMKQNLKDSLMFRSIQGLGQQSDGTPKIGRIKISKELKYRQLADLYQKDIGTPRSSQSNDKINEQFEEEAQICAI